MIRIYIRKQGQESGRVFKAKTSVMNDRVASLGYIKFVKTGKITLQEWGRSHQLIAEKFNLYITEKVIDGRLLKYKNVPYFSWDNVL